MVDFVAVVGFGVFGSNSCCIRIHQPWDCSIQLPRDPKFGKGLLVLCVGMFELPRGTHLLLGCYRLNGITVLCIEYFREFAQHLELPS